MTYSEDGLSGLRVLVTGGSRGLGEATVRRFAAAGATVLTASRGTPPEDLPATHFPADLATEDGVAELGRLSHRPHRRGGRAGQQCGWCELPAPTLQRSDESWYSDLEMNLLSAVRLDRALVPGMVERGSGVVVHVSSIASQLPQRTEASYAAAKAALNAYSRELATEVGSTGCAWCVSCRASWPPTAPTSTCPHRRPAGRRPRRDSSNRSWSTEVPMGRPGDPEDVAEMIAFLASGVRSG